MAALFLTLFVALPLGGSALLGLLLLHDRWTSSRAAPPAHQPDPAQQARSARPRRPDSLRAPLRGVS